MPGKVYMSEQDLDIEILNKVNRGDLHHTVEDESTCG